MASSSTAKFANEEVIDRFLANVDVWKTIFEMLSVKDRIQLEMTNKSLRILMLECWKRVTSFDTEGELSYNPSMSRKRKKNRRPSTLKRSAQSALKGSAPLVTICIDRIGDGLRSLTIRANLSMNTVWRVNLRSVGEGCPNIETINFVFVDGIVDIRLDSFSRLKTLTVSTSTAGHFPVATASVFLSIPASIEVIRGLKLASKEPFENSAQMEGFFADRPSMREVCLASLYARDRSKADMFRVIAERCPHLKSINLSSINHHYFDYSSVIALESMKELRIPDAHLDEMKIVTICERSPLVEALELNWFLYSDIDLQSAALNALGALTKLRQFYLWNRDHRYVVAPSLVTKFVRELARNSGASLRRLGLPYQMSLPTAAIEALANGCGKLRYLEFRVRIGEATPASIRFLIDCIVAHPSWLHQTDQPTLLIVIFVTHHDGDEAEAGMAAFRALADPAANLPSGVDVRIQ